MNNVETAAEYIERVGMSSTELELRRMVAHTYSNIALYHDDGELQDKREFPIDFLRDSIDTIKEQQAKRSAAKIKRYFDLANLQDLNLY